MDYDGDGNPIDDAATKTPSVNCDADEVEGLEEALQEAVFVLGALPCGSVVKAAFSRRSRYSYLGSSSSSKKKTKIDKSPGLEPWASARSKSSPVLLTASSVL